MQFDCWIFLLFVLFNQNSNQIEYSSKKSSKILHQTDILLETNRIIVWRSKSYTGIDNFESEKFWDLRLGGKNEKKNA